MFQAAAPRLEPIHAAPLAIGLLFATAFPASAGDDAFYAAAGQGGREYSVFNDARTNAGSTPAGAFRVGFNGDGRERQYAAKFNVARVSADALEDGKATLMLFAGSSVGKPEDGIQLDAGPHTQQDGVIVGVFLDPTPADASARIDPKFPKPGGGTYGVADSEFIDVSANPPLAAFTPDQLRDGAAIDVTPAFRQAVSNDGVLLLILAPVSEVLTDPTDPDTPAGDERGSPRDQTFIFRSGKAPDVPDDKRLRIEWSTP